MTRNVTDFDDRWRSYPTAKTHPLAVSALCLAIAGGIAWFFLVGLFGVTGFYWGIALLLAAVILAIVALIQIELSPDVYEGRNLAFWAIGVALVVIFLVGFNLYMLLIL